MKFCGRLQGFQFSIKISFVTLFQFFTNKVLIKRVTEIIEPAHEKTDMCTQRRHRSACAFAQSDQFSLCALRIAKDLRLLHADSEDPDQTMGMPRLIWIFAWCTDQFAGFVMLWYNYQFFHWVWLRLVSISQFRDIEPWFSHNNRGIEWLVRLCWVIMNLRYR